MKTYNHALTIGFEIISNNEDGDDITSEMVNSALLRRINDLTDSGYMLDAIDVFDTYEVES